MGNAMSVDFSERPKDRRRKPVNPPSVFVNGGVYGNGALQMGKPGVWTTNPTLFVGVPSSAYSATSGKKPVLAYRHSVAGRPYNGYTHLNTDKRNGSLPIYSHPDLRGNWVMEERRKQGILVDSNSSMVRAYSDYNGNKQIPSGQRHIAKVYSGYGDPSGKGNVARVYSNYSTPDLRMNGRHPVYPVSHVARAVVRSRDGTLDRIDEYMDVTASTPAVHLPYNNVLSKPQLTRPVTRTQSYQDRSPTRHLRPGSLIRSNAQNSNEVHSTANGFPGHKPLERSSSDTYSHSSRRLERRPFDDPHADPHANVTRTSSADQQTRQFAALPKHPQTRGDTSAKDTVRSNTIDSSCVIHSPIYASLGEATSSITRSKPNQMSSPSAIQRSSITEEDPNALYAIPIKIKRPQTEGGSGRSQVPTEEHSPSPPPPPPPPPLLRFVLDPKPESHVKTERTTEAPKRTLESPKPVKTSTLTMEPTKQPTEPTPADNKLNGVTESLPKTSSDLQTTEIEIKGEPKSHKKTEVPSNTVDSLDSNIGAVHKLENDSETFTYASAGQVTLEVFKFLDEFDDE